MVLTISTTKLFLAEVVVGYYNLLRWTCKPSDIVVNEKMTLVGYVKNCINVRRFDSCLFAI